MQGKKVTDYLLLSIPLDMLEEAGISAESVIQMSAVSGKILIILPIGVTRICNL